MDIYEQWLEDHNDIMFYCERLHMNMRKSFCLELQFRPNIRTSRSLVEHVKYQPPQCFECPHNISNMDAED